MHLDQSEHGIAPNWSTDAEEVLCPLCEYNLRGLTEARCPECGATYRWRELLNPDLRRQLDLFEVRRGPRAFFHTLKQTFWAERFWQGMHPRQPVHGERLMRYLLLTVGPSVAAIIVLIGIVCRDHAACGLIGCRDMWKQLVLAHLDVVTLALGPMIVVGTLFALRGSMRIARIQSRHVLRAFAYSLDILLVAFVLLAAYYGITYLLFDIFGGQEASSVGTAIISGPAFLFVGARLAVAYRRYLRFPESTGAIAAGMCISGLTLLNALLYFSLW